MSAYEKALAEIDKEETNPETTPTETKPEETHAEELKPEETHEEAPAEEQPTETPEETPAEDAPKKKDIPDDKVARAEYSFRRQLEKANRKHADEIAERDKKYAELESKFAALEKKLAPENAPKKRTDFASDDEYIDYLVNRRTEENLAKFREEEGAKAAERAAADKKKADADAEIQRQHDEWMANVHSAFGGDAKREQEFISKVQYCSQRGLGQILDMNPAAADFLMNNPHGPRVMEKLLNDKDTFDRVFPRSGRVSEMDVYYTLRRIDEEMDATQPTQTAEPVKPSMPKLGKPGKQAGGATAPDIFTDSDQMRNFVRRFR